MTALGPTKISKMFLGSQKIKEAYLGDKLVYRSGKPGRLPSEYKKLGYKELEYIESNSGQYIDTGVDPSVIGTVNPTKVVIDYDTDDSQSGTFLFGANAYYYSEYTSKYYVSRYGAQIGTYSSNPRVKVTMMSISGTIGYTMPPGVATPGKHTLTLDGPNKNGEYDGNAFSMSSSTVTSIASDVPTIALFCSHYNNKGTLTYVNPRNMKLYSCQMYQQSALVRDFVPCKNPSGVTGLFDLVNEKFYASGSGTAFIAGPSV